MYHFAVRSAEMLLDFRNLPLEAATPYKHLTTWQALSKLTQPTRTGLHSNWKFLVSRSKYIRLT